MYCEILEEEETATTEEEEMDAETKEQDNSDREEYFKLKQIKEKIQGY